MWIQDPAKLISISDERFFEEGRMHWQKSRMQSALENASTVPGANALTQASASIAEASGILLTTDALQSILTLYPVERGILAVDGWGDSELREQMLDVIAHFFVSSRWPWQLDDEDRARFVARLKKAASFMGYQVAS